VEAVHHRDVHQIVGREAAIALRFKVVGRIVIARLPCRRKKPPKTLEMPILPRYFAFRDRN
jgi:hypothetical protein